MEEKREREKEERCQRMREVFRVVLGKKSELRERREERKLQGGG